MEMKVFRSPTGDIAVQMTESRDLSLTMLLERPDAERLVEMLKEKLDLAAEIDWKDIDPDEEMAEHVRHQVLGLARGALLVHGSLDRLRANASLDAKQAAEVHRQLGDTVARLRTGRVDRITPDEDPTVRISELRKA